MITVSRPAAGLAATATTLLLTLTACGSPAPGPTSAQAGAELRADLSRSIHGFEKDDYNKALFTVTSSGIRDIPCGSGKAKRTYTARRTTGGQGINDPGFIDTAVDAMSTYLSESGHYTPARRRFQARPAQHFSTYDMTNATHHANATITGKATGQKFVLTISATTDCLRVS
ncbi:hypothetical protein [Actinacidiphila yeochonensis]|uniref:hypothetical protein n=1 Tax=Actinacidiphila yeochonensis TaxID=89050 RepID=UPI0012FE863A|nr:hypothetical protein [Actinacidiphila yeochonensis]